MSIHSVQTRLKSISQANRVVSQLIGRLDRLASTSDPANADQNDQARTDLVAEIQASLKELELDFELARQDAEDLLSGTTPRSATFVARDTERDREREAIATQVERVDYDLKLAHAQFRRAQLAARQQSRRDSEAHLRKQREQLFAGGDDPSTPSRPSSRSERRRGGSKLSQDELALSASGDVTASLRRTHQLMRAELERSEFAHATLQSSTAALRQLNDSHGALDALLASSKTLVGTLLRSQKSDTWYLESAFRILAATVVWLVFRRLFYGPVRYLLYLPLKLVLSVLLSFVQYLVVLVSGRSTAVETPLRSLKVQPSATGRAYKRNLEMPPQPVRVGAGGEGARVAPDDLKDDIGRMAERTRQQERGQQPPPQQGQTEEEAKAQEAEEVQEEAEGEASGLRDRRDDEPPNPKKRMWEEPPSREGRAKDEL